MYYNKNVITRDSKRLKKIQKVVIKKLSVHIMYWEQRERDSEEFRKIQRDSERKIQKVLKSWNKKVLTVYNNSENRKSSDRKKDLKKIQKVVSNIYSIHIMYWE